SLRAWLPARRPAGGSRISSWPGSVAGEVDETLFELTALDHRGEAGALDLAARRLGDRAGPHQQHAGWAMAAMTLHATDDVGHELAVHVGSRDRKSTRLNSSH